MSGHDRTWCTWNDETLVNVSLSSSERSHNHACSAWIVWEDIFLLTDYTLCLSCQSSCQSQAFVKVPCLAPLNKLFPRWATKNILLTLTFHSITGSCFFPWRSSKHHGLWRNPHFFKRCDFIPKKNPPKQQRGPGPLAQFIAENQVFWPWRNSCWPGGGSGASIGQLQSRRCFTESREECNGNLHHKHLVTWKSKTITRLWYWGS